MEEYVFLKRKPRVFLIGNPEELGFREKESEFVGYTRLVDDYGVTWVYATIVAEEIINQNAGVPYGLFVEWFDGNLYALESAKSRVRFDEQGYQEFWKLVLKAKEENNPEELFKYSPPITEYAIPKTGTRERILFSMFVRVYSGLVEEREKKKKEVRKHLDAIKNIL